MSWNTKPLGSIARISAGQGAPQRADEFGPEGRPFVRAGSLERLCAGESEDVLEKIPDSVAKKRRLTLHPAGTIVFAKSGMSATMGRVYKLTQPSYIVNHLATVNADTGVDTAFLAHFFRFSPPSRLIRDSAYPSIRLSDISAWEIPLPTMDEQRRISAILDKADALIRLRHKSAQVIEKLIRSIFINMFGDPRFNTMNWPESTIGEILRGGPQNGLYRPRSDYGSGTRILRIDGFYDGEVLDEENLKRLRLSPRDAEPYLLKEGDIVINRVNSLEYLGKSAVIPKFSEPVVFESNMMRMSTNDDRVLPRFLIALLQTPYIKSQILSCAKKAVNQASINQMDVKGLKIIEPPTNLQREFVLRIDCLKRLRKDVEIQGTIALELRSSLQQIVFRGELDLSRVRLAPQAEVPTSSDLELSASQTARPAGKAFLIAPGALESDLETLATLIRQDGPMPWSADYFKYRVLGTMPAPFSFDDLMARVNGVFSEEPPYEEIKSIILELLGQSGGPALLSQRFDLQINENISEISGRKEMVFEPKS